MTSEKVRKENAIKYRERGDSEYDLGDLERAALAYRKSLEQIEDSIVHNNLATVYLDTGQISRALKHLDWAVTDVGGYESRSASALADEEVFSSDDEALSARNGGKSRKSSSLRESISPVSEPVDESDGGSPRAGPAKPKLTEGELLALARLEEIETLLPNLDIKCTDLRKQARDVVQAVALEREELGITTSDSEDESPRAEDPRVVAASQAAVNAVLERDSLRQEKAGLLSELGGEMMAAEKFLLSKNDVVEEEAGEEAEESEEEINPVELATKIMKAVPVSRPGTPAASRIIKEESDQESWVALASYYNNRAQCLRSMGCLEEALADMTRAVTLCPFEATYFNNRAGILREMEAIPLALRDHARAIRLNSKDASFLNNRGVTRCQSSTTNDNPESALLDFNKALTLEPDQVAYLNNRGICKKLLQDFEGAIADYTSAIRLEPLNHSSLYNRANVHELIHNYDEAIADYEKALELQPKSEVLKECAETAKENRRQYIGVLSILRESPFKK